MKQLTICLLLNTFLVGATAHSANRCEAIFVTDVKSQFETREVMDVSRTEKALTYISAPSSKGQILQAIAYAKEHDLKITVKGTNHSHGGHNRKSEDTHGNPRAIQLDMIGYNKILKFEPALNEVTVQSGVTWKDLSVFLNERGLAAMTEQSSNIFSIGGSVSTNVHGRDVHGPLANSIKAIQFIDANGVERKVSREIEPELFRAIIGGYGAFGVITEVTLKVEKNYLYEAHSTKDVSVSEYMEYLKNLPQKPDDIMHYARVNISGNQSFQKVSYVEWKPINEKAEPATWKGWKLDLVEKNRWASAMVMNLMRYRPTSNFGKYVKDFLDKFLGLPKTGARKTKNNILNNPVQFLFDSFYNKKESVDILQEYFLPVDKLEPFLERLKETTNKHQLDLMNVTMRYIPKIEKKNDGILSPYSDKQDLVAVVLYFNIKEAKNLRNGLQVQYDGSVWTQELIQGSQDLGGTFYWPYHRWWSVDQINHRDRENIQSFFKMKEQVDPANIFESDFIFHLKKTQN
ncbi:FAD-binding oxidoreductase [Bdellovibrio svalbardensis]|uniref:FAD-binding oxidoreductase n=1 Tax=Bdellovibrio svalbardensis TaxID=2972972 RepID=A0ABT6DJV4_9BACT|nr:FAD-binding oxidoreductase [Bdellovibrio svalbardensis]MDG0817151.1 FAD-binding oxidoreductase [Bdellovibrio svalbardensis]